MGGRVPEDVEGVWVVLVTRGQDLDALAVLHGQAEVANGAVRAQENRLLCELGPDRPCRVEARCAVGKFELGVIGKNDLDHERRGYSGTFAARAEAYGGRHTGARPGGRAGRRRRRSTGRLTRGRLRECQRRRRLSTTCGRFPGEARSTRRGLSGE